MLAFDSGRVCLIHTHDLSVIPTTRSHRDSSSENEEARESENFSKLPDHLQSGHWSNASTGRTMRGGTPSRMKTIVSKLSRSFQAGMTCC
ncbi:hypothetical protein AVEN_150523-1 [Araneus ventricosus]|uniref:Uncharacterized protein n=1 Tax=Araneus ventricosus TaxID=182803 RepID=A0A4Y2E1T8_ARAVE|nr:hypothetical protein AVEN_150523-1 [Araneus ventricosus]